MDGKNVQDALISFREEWQREIEEIQKKGKCKDEEIKSDNTTEEGIVQVAEKLFLKGVENEQNGRLYEAIQFYKKAVQLVPDIESKLYESFKLNQVKSGVTNQPRGNKKKKKLGNGEEQKLDLSVKLRNYFTLSGTICLQNKPQKSTHISALPVEIIIYILRWVVSSDLDLRSLEMCSMVCRGFYVCSRDPEIWKSACAKIWGRNCGGSVDYSAWRQMYLKRPRLNFNGCYISKTTYIRQGENSFQDQFYRPLHVIEYYRYLRFFPEGKVLMLTTPDLPAAVVALLKFQDVRNPSILTGRYRLHEDRIILFLQRQDFSGNSRYRQKRNNSANDITNQVFRIELEIISNKHRINNQLQWKYYCISTKRGLSDSEVETEFQVTDNKFPPFWYSRVISYTAESLEPLL